MPRAATLLSGAVYAALAVADSVAAGRSSASARQLRYVLKPASMPALATAFLRIRRSRDRGRPQARTAGRRAGRGSTPCT